MCEHYDYYVCIHASADLSTRRAQQEDLNKRNWRETQQGSCHTREHETTEMENMESKQ